MRHLDWFDDAPVVEDKYLSTTLRTFIDGQPFNKAPDHNWIRFMPPVDQRWDFVVNLGVDGFGLSVVLFYVLKNRRRDTSQHVRTLLGSSLTLLKYGMNSVARSPSNGLFFANSTKSIIPAKRTWSENTGGRLAVAGPAVRKVVSRTNEIRANVLVIHDSDSEGEGVIDLDSSDEDRDRPVDRLPSSVLQDAQRVRKSKRSRTQQDLPVGQTNHVYPVNKEFGELLWRWGNNNDTQLEFIKLLYEFTDIHSTVSKLPFHFILTLSVYYSQAKDVFPYDFAQRN